MGLRAADNNRPDFLKQGDKVAIISPSYYTKDSTKLTRALQVIRGWGLEPVLSPNLNNPSPLEPGLQPDNKKNYYGGSDLDRISDLLWALCDPEIKAIICQRGGYGTIHLMKMIPQKIWEDNPKWLVGYSDITTLHAMANVSGAMTIHGNMCGDIGKKEGPDEATDALRDLLFGKIP
ncbi:MAG: LD-carboxypeptidase, partial [Bacteroidales bacterium]|nr:LD-carboxypeptidase [Bacteroidales bacterium]